MEMGQLERLRNEALASRYEEVQNVVSSRKRKLQELYAVSRHIERSKPFPNETTIARWGLPDDPKFSLEEPERKFLDANDIEKGFYFKETSLPTYAHSYPTQAPEPQIKPSVVAPPVIQPKSTAATPTSTRASSPLQPIHSKKPSQALIEPKHAQEPISIPRKTSPSSHEPLPSPREEVEDNEDVEDHNTPRLDKPIEAQSPEEVTTVPPTPSPPTSPRLKKLPEVREATPAPVLNIGNVPVIQETATAIPDERERALGVHPPPPPPELGRDNDQTDDVPPAVSPSPALSPPPQSPPPTTKRVQLDLEKEIPDSQGSPTKAGSEAPSLPEGIEEARLPAVSSQLQQLPVHPPLVVDTDPAHKPRTIPPQKPIGEERIQREVSSPASSVELGENRSTPGAGPISSATSPDGQFATPERPKATVAEESLRAVSEELDHAGEAVEDNGDALVEKSVDIDGDATTEELPSTAVAAEVVNTESEAAVQLPTIPSKELPAEEPLRREEEARESKLPCPVESQPKDPTPRPSSITTDKAVVTDEREEATSPDPSAQLRLEHLLANGEARPTSPNLATQPGSNQSAKDPSVSSPPPAQQKPALPPPPLPSTSEQEDVLEEEFEDDRVQLVGSHEPVSRIPSPVTAKNAQEPEPELPPASETLKEEPKEQPLRSTPEPKSDANELEEGSPQSDASVHTPNAQAEPIEGDSQIEPEILRPDLDTENQTSEKVFAAEVSSKRLRTPSPHAEEAVDEDVVMDDAEPEMASSAPEETPDLEEKLLNDSNAENREKETPERSLDTDTKSSPRVEQSPPLEEEDVSTMKQAPTTPEKSEIPEDIAATTSLGPQGPAEDVASPTVEPLEPQPRAEPSDPLTEPVPADATEKDAAVGTQLSNVNEPIDAQPTEITPPTIATSSGRTARRKKHPEGRLSKVVISSAHHAAVAAEAEARRLREDQEQQGMIVVARREAQQAASAAAKGRSSLFTPGSKLDYLTRFNIADQAPKDKKPELFDVLYTTKSYGSTVGQLMERSTKTLTTENHLIQSFESQAVKVLTRIQELQDQDLWSLRQLARAPEPKRKMAHWDYVLDEMKWLREDFREERKWKLAVARQMAGWIMEWHRTGKEGRSHLLVDRKRVGKVPKGWREERRRSEDVAMSDMSQPTPELITSDGSPEEEGSEDYFVKKEGAGEGMLGISEGDDMFGHLKYPPPAAVFTLGPEDTVFNMFPTKAADEVMAQLPLYGPPKPPTSDTRLADANEPWLLPITPVTKYAVGRITLRDAEGPPRKRSRYEYDANPEPYADDSDEEGYIITSESASGDALDAYGRPRSRDKDTKPTPLPPEQTNVALFRTEFKPTLQRIRSHTFRPPSDMPPMAFFDCRSPSLWTAAEDEQLRLLAKEYHHNWGLVSTFMSLDGLWHSGSERRSPWECFERWLSLEPIPQEFTKAPYYKHVQHRLDAARVGGQYGATNSFSAGSSQSQAGGMVKRRGTAPIRVEKRRSGRFMTVVESMRKLAKKRETSVNKNQQSAIAAQKAAMRKNHESQQGNNSSGQSRSPAYFSHMKYEKERQTEAQIQEQKKMLQHLNAQRAAQSGQPNRVPPGTHLANGTTVPTQPRLGTPTTQGSPVVATALPNGMAVSQNPSVQHPLPPQLAAGMRTQIQPNGRQLSPAETAQLQRIRHAQMMQTPQMMMAVQQQATQAALGTASGTNLANGSTRATVRVPTHQEMTNQIRQNHPQATQQQLDEMARQQLAAYHAQLSSNMAMRNPVLRQQQSTQQQQQQRQNANTGILMSANGPVGPGSGSVPASRSATPQGPQQANGVSPRIPQQQQQQQAQQQAQQQPPTAPMAGQMQQQQ